MLDLDLTKRIGYDAERNALFLNFEGLTVRRPDDVLVIERAVAGRAFYDASGAERGGRGAHGLRPVFPGEGAANGRDPLVVDLGEDVR